MEDYLEESSSCKVLFSPTVGSSDRLMSSCQIIRLAIPRHWPKSSISHSERLPSKIRHQLLVFWRSSFQQNAMSNDNLLITQQLGKSDPLHISPILSRS